MRTTAKVFTTGRSQAVRLPAAFRFDTKEVFVHRDPKTGDVILSRKPSWDEVFEAIAKAPMPDDFLSPQDRDRSMPKDFKLL